MGVRLFSIIVLLGLWGWASANSQQTFISGEDPTYSGVSIRFYIPDHPFLDKSGISKTLRCDSSGAFRLELKPNSECTIILMAGIYEASLHIEPGKSYIIQLPPYRKLAYAEIISPFFEPLRIPLKVSGDYNNTNNQIFRFDSVFNALNEQVILARRRGTEPMADSIIGRLKKEFPPGTSNWFDAHAQYKKGILKLNEGKTKLDHISLNYLGPIVRENHSAYLELFGAMFKDFLVYYNRTPEGGGIRHHINRTHNLDSLRKIVTTHPAVTNDTIRDLILLQELPPMFYRGDYHKEAILILLDSLEADAVSPSFAAYAATLREKLSSLIAGYPPPDFNLPDTTESYWSPANFKGKYTYLMFCTPEHYGCMMEYPFLESYIPKHNDYLEVVCIMVAEYPEQVASFMERNLYHFKALYYGGETKILDNYLIKAFPVAYLIGPDGNLILSPAPLPTDGFEQQLFRIMRSRGEI
jgi:hypothetical protein